MAVPIVTAKSSYSLRRWRKIGRLLVVYKQTEERRGWNWLRGCKYLNSSRLSDSCSMESSRYDLRTLISVVSRDREGPSEALLNEVGK